MEHMNESTLIFTDLRVSFKLTPSAVDKGKTMDTNPTIVSSTCNSAFEQK